MIKWWMTPTFGDIKVEEVTVEDSLDHTSHNGDHVKEALKVETPDPVEEIERPIQAQGEQVVGGDRLCLSGLTDHEELRKDCHRLQVDWECPQDLMADKLYVQRILKTNTIYATIRFYTYKETVYSHIGSLLNNEWCHALITTQESEPTSRREKSWLMRTARPPTGTTRNSTLKLSWLPS